MAGVRAGVDAQPPGVERPMESEPNSKSPEPEQEVGEEEETSVTEEARDKLQKMVPWMVSFLFHTGFIILLIFMVWVEAVEQEEKRIIPTAQLAQDPGGRLADSQQSDLAKTQNLHKVESQSVAAEPSPQNLQLSTSKSQLRLIGVSGGGGGGKLAPFGTTSGSGDQLGASFYGKGGNATQIIYIVDASGSLIEAFPFVIDELKRSIQELSPKQQFTIFFFQRGKAIEVPVPHRGWKRATKRNTKLVSQWISHNAGNIIPRGSTNPIPALKKALQYEPELVFLLSDNITGAGKYEINRSRLLGMLKKLTRGDNVKINTIQFLYPDPLHTLKTIARKFGGTFKFIRRSDLGLE